MSARFRRRDLTGWLLLAGAVVLLALVHGELPSLGVLSQIPSSLTPALHSLHEGAPQPSLSLATQAKDEAACQRIQGSWTNPVCKVAYQSPIFQQTYRYTVTFDANGGVVPSSCADQAWTSTHDCLRDPLSVAQARADCLAFTYNGYAVHSLWHDDTDVCSI